VRTRILSAACIAASLVVGATPSIVAQSRSRRPIMVARQFDSLAKPITHTEAGVIQAGRTFLSRRDSVEWEHNRTLATKARGFHIVVSMLERHLWVLDNRDTLLSAPVAVAKGTELNADGQTWVFDTPRGVRTVQSKDANPIWQPPDWLYEETAQENGLKVRRLTLKKPFTLSDGRKLSVRNGYVGVIDKGEFAPLPTKEHIVFDNTLFIPPFGTKNREVPGELGKFKLSLGNGYLLHGTPYNDSIGLASTHGCVRMRDEDIQWLYDNVPVGTKVYIY
jgi:hypothetical protein